MMCCNKRDRDLFMGGYTIGVLLILIPSLLLISERLSLIQQHHATLAKPGLSDYHRQILHQQLDSLYQYSLWRWNHDAFSRILQVIDGPGSESSPSTACRAQKEEEGGSPRAVA